MTPIAVAPPPADPDLHDPAAAEIAPVVRPIIPPSSRRGLPQRFFGLPLGISAGVHAALLGALLLYLQFGPEMTPVGRIGGPPVQYVDLVTPSEIGAETPEDASQPQESVAEPPRGAVLVPGAAPGVITSQGGDQPMPAPPPGATGGGGVAERLRPGFSDPRLYAAPGVARMRLPAMSNVERYQRHFESRIEALNDSMYGGGPNTDWTVRDGSGNRWGVSEEGIHLGPLTVPRALVPFPAATGTNADLEEARDQRRQREEIDRQEADREVRKAREESAAAARARREQESSDDGDSDN
jgi:hypothetical protein